MNQSFFLRTFFHSALAILEPQIYVVVEQFRAENISLLSGRLVRFFSRILFVVSFEPIQIFLSTSIPYWPGGSLEECSKFAVSPLFLCQVLY